MGLPICRSIVEAHGGSLRVKDNQPQGATLQITFPIEAENFFETDASGVDDGADVGQDRKWTGSWGSQLREPDSCTVEVEHDNQ